MSRIEEEHVLMLRSTVICEVFYSYTDHSCALMLYCDDVITAAAIAIIL